MSTLRAIIRRQPIKIKLLLIILVSVVVALIVEGASLIAYERLRARQDLLRDLGSLARVIADRSTAALSFDDESVARETLAALKAKPDVTAACIYNANGQIFARYQSGSDADYPFPENADTRQHASIDGQYAHLMEPVVMDGATIGSVFVRASLRDLDRIWQNFLIFSSVIGFFTVAVTLLVANRLQRLVSGPLEHLTGTVRRISTDDDFGLRAPLETDDEIGDLVRAFNGMLDTIENRSEALLQANRLLATSEEQLKSTNEDLEQRVAARTAELQALFDSASVGIALLKSRIILRGNSSLDDIFGRAPGSQIGQSARIWFADDASWASISEQVESTLSRGETDIRELTMRRDDGRDIWVRLAVRGIATSDGSLGAVAVLQDITALRTAIDDMRNAKTLAEAATRMKSEFLANMSHEIRTPMNAILGMLYLALKNEMPDHMRNHLSKAHGSAQLLLGIINDILDFSKIEAGKLEIEQVEFSLDSALERVADTIGAQTERKGLEFLIRHDVNIPSTLVGDPLRLGQVLLNLCGNAVKFTEHGEIELSVRLQENDEKNVMLQISVRDSGIGMPPDVQARLFEKFTQADQSTTRRFGGTGLGLAICKNLVELMGGRIWIENSAPGQGSTISFTVRLGIAQQGQTRRQELLGQVGPMLEGSHVLVVDDNEASREILGGMLRHFHVDIHTVSDGPSAIATLTDTALAPFDLALVDWRMPGMNGDELTRRIRTDPAIVRKPKVVLVTAYGREEVIRSAEEAGVDAFLIKPVSPSMLLDTVLTTLGRGQIPHFDRRRSSGDAASGESHTFTGAHMLLVEDNEINREFAGELLRSMGIELDEAVNGAEALAKVRKFAYDGILMDVQMPVMDGLEAAQQIRALAKAPGGERFASVPIIAMTALAMASDVEQSRSAGMNDHVTKPIDPPLLVEALTRWIHPAQPVTPGKTSNTPASAPTTPSPTRAVQGLDVDTALHRIGGNRSLYLRLLGRFRENYADAVSKLRTLAAEQGAQAAEEYCHGLKGVCGNLGATALYEAAAALDVNLKAGRLPETAELERIDELLRLVMEDIDRMT